MSWYTLRRNKYAILFLPLFLVAVNSKRKVFDPRSKYTGQKFCMVQFSLWSLKCFVALVVVNLNIETEKSEQTMFAQISLGSMLRLFLLHFKDCNTKLDHAEPLSLSLFLQKRPHCQGNKQKVKKIVSLCKHGRETCRGTHTP